MSVSPNNLCQIEIVVSDLEQSQKFYEQVFNWKSSPAEIHNLVVFDVPRDCPFGISLVGGAATKGSASGLAIYFEVDDLSIVKEAAETALPGCTSERMLPSRGRVLVIKDPDGNRVGVYAGP